jgi:hypothetical protein
MVRSGVLGCESVATLSSCASFVEAGIHAESGAVLFKNDSVEVNFYAGHLPFFLDFL